MCPNTAESIQSAIIGTVRSDSKYVKDIERHTVMLIRSSQFLHVPTWHLKIRPSSFVEFGISPFLQDLEHGGYMRILTGSSIHSIHDWINTLG